MVESQIKVSSIMFTDIVDYSKMVQRDQALALELVEEHNQIIKGNIGKYPGKIIKFTGDGFMAEFDSSASAVTAAIAIQKDLSLRNETQPDKRQITIRIGIHTGDVIREGDDLVGDGVNIASRLEGIAPHGGIAVSNMVWQSVKNEKGIFAREVGKVILKNITEPEIIYKVYLNQLDYKSENRETLLNDFKARNVNFAEVNELISIRTYERGDEMESLSCGTGSVATAIALYEIGKTDDKEINIHTTGGELKVSFNHDGKKYTNIWLSGYSSMVYSGEFEC